MPIIDGPNANEPQGTFAAWGVARYAAGQKDVVEPHYHDCDEYYFLFEGRMVAVSEGIRYTMEAGDVLLTRMGDENAIVEILEDAAFFWCETELKGLKRRGHLHR